MALLRACCSARDRLIVLLMARPGLRRGEVLGLRRGDVHLLADSGALSCPVARAHLHVVRRQDNPNRAVAKSRRQRAVPLGFLTVQAFDSYELERMTVPAAASSDFVFVNLFRAPLGVPMRLDAVNDLVAAAARRAGIAGVQPHQMRHAFASNVWTAAGRRVTWWNSTDGRPRRCSAGTAPAPAAARARRTYDRIMDDTA